MSELRDTMFAIAQAGAALYQRQGDNMGRVAEMAWEQQQAQQALDLAEMDAERRKDERNAVIVECARWLNARGLRDVAKQMLGSML